MIGLGLDVCAESRTHGESYAVGLRLAKWILGSNGKVALLASDISETVFLYFMTADQGIDR